MNDGGDLARTDLARTDLARTDLGIAIAALDSLPIGVALFNAAQRAVVVNAAYCASLDMPPGSFPPGTTLADMMQEQAYRGVFGPGDPRAQAAAGLAADRSRPGRLRRRRFAGRVYDLHSAPLPPPDGGHVVCAVDLTAPIEARDLAQEALRRVTAALAALRVGLAVFGPRGLLLGNPRFAELLALPPELLRDGLTFAKLIAAMRACDDFAGQDGEAFIDAQAMLDRSRPASHRLVRADGVVIDLASDPLGADGWTMTATDISMLARAEDDSRRRAEMLASILDAIPHGVAVYGPDLRVTMVNRNYAVVMDGAPISVGEHRHDIIARRLAAGEFGRGAKAGAIADRIATDHALRASRCRRWRGNGRCIESDTAALPDGGHIRVVTDVTALVSAEREIGRRAAEMDAMLANIGHGIMMYDRDRRLVACNAIARTLLGHPPELLRRGTPLIQILRHMRERGEFGDGPEAETFTAERFARPNHESETYQRATRSGRWLQVMRKPTPDGGFVYTYTDITEARAAQSELRRAKEAAEQASLAKSRFLATMSHELRTPLHSVIGFSDALLRQGPASDPARVAEYAAAINQSGRDLLSIINSILDVSRLETGRFDLACDTIQARILIESRLRAAEHAARTHGVTLAPAVADPALRLSGDERRLGQAIDHLLSNAIKFTGGGGIVTVGAAAHSAGGVLITVADTGIGMTQADLARVFEPFTQLDPGLSRRFPGMGLGLYSARALVEAHGGTLALNSAPNEGTCAIIHLPPDRMMPPGAISTPKEIAP